MINFLGRYWFALALVALLLVAIPGVLLFCMHVYGVEGPVNRWLQDNYELTYHLPIPWWGALILLLVPLAILVLYFLKLKRKPLAVPSTFLWRKSIEDLHVNSLLQWLRQNVLLLLQLLVLLGLIYSVMGFRFHGRAGQGRHYVLMIDNSASMGATDVAPSRLEQAKAEALKEIDAVTDSDFGMVIAFNSSAEILQSFTSNRALLRQAVRDIPQTERPTRIEEALGLADSFANPIRSTEDVASQPENVEPGKERTYVPPKGVSTTVHLFSDGRFPDLSDAALANMNSRRAGNESVLGNIDLQFHLAGKPGPENVDNVGIVTFNALRDDRDPTKLQAFVRCMNFRAQETPARVQLEVHVNGALKSVYEKPLTLPARKVLADKEGTSEGAGPQDTPGEGSVNFELSDIDEHADAVLRARVLDVNDRFPLDDEAWLVVGLARKAKVLVVGKSNDVLHKFFDADEVREAARVDYLSPEDLPKDAYRKPARNGTYDFVLFDRCAPATEQDMPRSNTFFVGYPPPPWKRNTLETIESPHITGWMSNHSALRDLRALYAVEIDQSFKMKDLPPRTPLLIEARQITKDRNTDTALLVALSRQSFTDLVMTFPIITDTGEWNTTWPLQASFPLFLRNVLYSLGNLNEGATEETIQPGQIKTLRPDGTASSIEVVSPDGKRQKLTNEGRESRTDFNFGATDHVGVYRFIEPGGTPRSFAVNLLDADESNIEPRPIITIGSDRVEAGREHGQPRELWKWFAVAALALLMLEWYIYNRRIYI
jgi:hypothetical protein